MRLLERVARDLSIALIVGVGIGLTLTYVGIGEALHLVPSQPDQDWQAYLGAAERLRTGLPLYPAVADPGAASVYRYAPWFAVAWIPLPSCPARRWEWDGYSPCSRRAQQPCGRW